jgi:hypothetical protein
VLSATEKPKGKLNVFAIAWEGGKDTKEMDLKGCGFGPSFQSVA